MNDWSWENLQRRLGKFTITRETWNSSAANALIGLLRTTLILQTTSDFLDDSQTYMAVSPDFPEIPEGNDIPEYAVECWVENIGEETEEVKCRFKNAD